MHKKNIAKNFITIIVGMFVLHMLFNSVYAEQKEQASGTALPPADEFNLTAYRGEKVVLLLYSIYDPRAGEAVSLMNDLHVIQKEYNYRVAGVCLNADKAEDVQLFNQTHKINFPVYLDHEKRLALRLKMKGSLGVYIFDKHGKPIARKWAVYTPAHVNLKHNWRAYASRYLSLGHIPDDQPFLDSKPPVPHFEAETLDGNTLSIQELYKSKPVIIVIFSPKCSNCRKELDFLQSVYSSGELSGTFEIVAISIYNKRATAEFFSQKKYGFPVISDPARKICSQFPSFVGPVPISFIIDTQGRINAAHSGFNSYLRDVYVMELKKLVALPNPPLLFKAGYSGEQRCRICHEKEHMQWSLTRHADAFQSLIRKGKEDDGACLSCHVTGFGKQGGYMMENRRRSKHLKNVQCESCHGPGHEACTAFTGSNPEKKKAAAWKQICISCHTEKESLNFKFAKRYPRVLHSSLPDLASMTRQEKLTLLQEYNKKENIFDNPAQYVGAESCKNCHGYQYDHWGKTLHARAHTAAIDKPVPPEKLFRYHTGLGSEGGYPEQGREGVQCEACHGPGERHLAEPEAKGDSYIVSLGDDCMSCVVEQICRSCHSPEDDPDFDFEKQIDQIRHKQPEQSP